MESGKRISAKPRPCCRRRVQAKKRPRSEASANTVRKLQRREISWKREPAFNMRSSGERFLHFQLQEEFDTYDPKGYSFTQLPYLRKRSKIIEIVSAKNIVFALSQSGVCSAYSRETSQRICFLNGSPDEIIRSLFYNKRNDTLITVSVCAADNFSSLKCRSTRIEYIKRGELEAGFAIFESELLKWPGFVEFDDVNGKILTYSSHNSPGIMLIIFTRESSHVPLKILNIEDGIVLKSFNHLLHRNKKLDFIEQFNEKLLIKQENENLLIIDVRDSRLTEVSSTEFITPSAFIFLYENQLFLTFRNRTVTVWNFRGELITSFEDHSLWHPDCNTNNIYITSDQDLIISYCKANSDDSPEGNAVGSINISNIFTGKSVAKIQSSNLGKSTGSSRLQCTETEALSNITAIYCDEDRNEIYSGNAMGLVHVWSN